MQERNRDGPEDDHRKQVAADAVGAHLIEKLHKPAKSASVVRRNGNRDSLLRHKSDEKRRERHQQPEQPTDEEVIAGTLQPRVLARKDIILQLRIGTIAMVMNEVRDLEKMVAARK